MIVLKYSTMTHANRVKESKKVQVKNEKVKTDP